MELLRRRSLLALLSAEILSTTGAQMTWLALPWFVLTSTGSPARMGLVMAVELAPLPVVGILGGSVVARIGARKTMLACDLARAPVMALVPALHLAGVLSFPLLLALVFVLGAFWAPYFSSQRLILPDLLGDDERRLAQANALLQAATRLTLVLGPAAAGMLIGVIGPVNVLFVDAATYLIAFALVLVFVPAGSRAPESDESRGVLAGVRFLVRDRMLGPLTATTAVIEMAFQALIVVIPVLVVARFGADARVAGWLFAAWGAGSLLGNVAVYRIVTRFPLLVLVALGGILQAAVAWFLVPELAAIAVAGALFCLGLFNGLVAAPMFGILTGRTPASLRPKVITASFTLSMLAGPLGIAVAGPALEELGTQPVLAAIAAIWSAAALAFALVALRRRELVGRPESAHA
jgi:MFS family permease